MTAEVHPTAVVDPSAAVGAGVIVGPYCVVGPDVLLGPGVRLQAHVVVEGRTALGPRTRVWPFAVLGSEPQHHRHEGEPGRLTIGADCTIREHVTAHVGSSVGDGVTQVGDGVTLMVSAHVAHDCAIGDGAILANDVHLGGHVAVGPGANLGGCCAVHQFVRIGAGAIVGGGSVLVRDLVPYGMAVGNRAVLTGLNLIGLRRAGVANADIRALQGAVETLLGATSAAPFAERTEVVRQGTRTPQIDALLAFVDGGTRRFCTAASSAEASRP
ncbi:MAG: acyl-ACP--UDP-N-acetylglucosamine O-acyltransferase [Proteobacteria bacterium]|nr:acyl-ACP--UDP-N-acetylglucosamine O-acyltransferase [Pseudomonadota bacterium]